MPRRPFPTQTPPTRARAVVPVLTFPEAGLDDSAAYQGYRTRLYRDAADNTVQVYLDGRVGRVVHVLADAENESIAFTARDSASRPVTVRWDAPGATVSRTDRCGAPGYAHVHVPTRGRRPARAARPVRAALDAGRTRISGPSASPGAVRRRLRASRSSTAWSARSRSYRWPSSGDSSRSSAPRTWRRCADASCRASRWTCLARANHGAYVARVVQPSLDARDTLTLEIRADDRAATIARDGDTFVLSARPSVRRRSTARRRALHRHRHDHGTNADPIDAWRDLRARFPALRRRHAPRGLAA